MSKPLYALSDDVLEQLRANVAANVHRYSGHGFAGLQAEPGWEAPVPGLSLDEDILSQLDPSEKSALGEARNSLLVHDSLSGMNRALAREERIWVRLSHAELFEYSRRRWIDTDTDNSVARTAASHFFARTLTETRDDHAIARLWWNAEVAKSIDYANPLEVLQWVLKTTDIRSGLIERARITSRPVLARAIVLEISQNPPLTDHAVNFRKFMKRLNIQASGVLFEALPESHARSYVRRAAEEALQE